MGDVTTEKRDKIRALGEYSRLHGLYEQTPMEQEATEDIAPAVNRFASSLAPEREFESHFGSRSTWPA